MSDRCQIGVRFVTAQSTRHMHYIMTCLSGECVVSDGCRLGVRWVPFHVHTGARWIVPWLELPDHIGIRYAPDGFKMGVRFVTAQNKTLGDNTCVRWVSDAFQCVVYNLCHRSEHPLTMHLVHLARVRIISHSRN